MKSIVGLPTDPTVFAESIVKLGEASRTTPFLELGQCLYMQYSSRLCNTSRYFSQMLTTNGRYAAEPN
jgi:hypothetical protein